MRSVAIVTTPTSGSASIQRIVSALLPDCPPIESPRAALEPEGRLYMIRGDRVFQEALPSGGPRYVVNFRDPRDMLCNQFHWLTQHPAANEQARLEHIRRREQGIDAAVLRMKDDRAYRHVFSLVGSPDALFVSYAQLCCDFLPMIARLTSFLGVRPTPAAMDEVALESPEGLAANPRWIGQNWAGCDIAPGRFRTELKPETIEALNRTWETTLERLQALEQPHLRHLYDR